MTLHTSFFRFVSAVCCGTLIALPLQNGYVTSAAPDAATTFANSVRALQDAENAAPRDHWDPKYVEAQLGNNPARTFAWVRDHTYWIPYHGILRGPVGVLMDRQGDSLDRALLLATMLKDEGQTVRLAHGTMASDRAARLMPALMSARTIRDAIPKTAASIGDVGQVAAKYQLDPESIRKTVAAQTAAHAQEQRLLDQRFGAQVRGLVAAAGSPATNAGQAGIEKAVGALADHWWVDVQSGGSWKTWDLLMPNAGTAMAAADRTIDPVQLPADLFHQITIRVVAEQWSGGTTSAKPALETTFRTADVIGLPISLQIAPGQSMTVFPAPGKDAAATLRDDVLSQHEWTPSLDIGKQHIVQNAITEGGTLTVPVNDHDVLAVAKGVTHGLAGAIDDVFGSAPAPTPAPASVAPGVLSAAWIEYAIAVPGEAVRTERRQLFDLPGPAARAARSTSWRLDDAARLERGLALMMTTEILPVSCELSSQYVTHLSRQAILANASAIADVVSGKITDDFGGAQAVSGRFVRNSGSIYALAMHRLNQSPVAALIYVDRPEVLSRHLFVSVNHGALVPTAATDIVANGVGVNPLGPSPFTIAVAQGVYDTNGEAVLNSSKPDAGSAAWAYDTPSNWITITKPNDPALSSIQLGADVRQRINAALAANHVVVAPRTRVAVGAGTFAGWWQVDKATGETLGMGETGWGQDLPEWAVILLTYGSIFVNGWLFCKLQPNANAPAPIVASAGFGAVHQRRLSSALEVPIEARGDGCLSQAFLGLLLGMMGAAYGAATAGGGSGGPGGELPEDLGSAKTEPDLGRAPTEPDLNNASPQGSGGGAAGSGGAGRGGNPGAGSGSGGGGSTPPPEGNPGGGKYTRQELLNHYIDQRGQLETQTGTGNEGRWQKEFIMRQPGVKDWVRDDLAKDLGYPPGEGNQPDPPQFQQWQDRFLNGGGGGGGGNNGSAGSGGGVSGSGGGGGGTTGGGAAGGDEIPPTLKSSGLGSPDGKVNGQGSGSGTNVSGSTTPTLPGIGPCAPSCGPSAASGPSGTTTLVGLGGAIGALGGS